MPQPMRMQVRVACNQFVSLTNCGCSRLLKSYQLFLLSTVEDLLTSTYLCSDVNALFIVTVRER